MSTGSAGTSRTDLPRSLRWGDPQASTRLSTIDARAASLRESLESIS